MAMVTRQSMPYPVPVEECSAGGVLVPEATKPVGGYSTESMMHGWCDVKPLVTFPAKEHCHCPLTGTHSHSTEDMRLSWPGWLVTYQDVNSRHLWLVFAVPLPVGRCNCCCGAVK